MTEIEKPLKSANMEEVRNLLCFITFLSFLVCDVTAENNFNLCVLI